MRFFTILCLIGLAVASTENQLKWQPGQRYTFRYNGRLLTGLPELASHWSGLGIRCDVHVTAGARSDRDSHEFGIEIKNTEFSRINEQLRPREGESQINWRTLELPNFTPINEDSRRMLETPAVFKLSPRGTFRSVVVSENEAEWSVNFKKALVALFQTQFHVYGSRSLELSDSVNRIEQNSEDMNEQGERMTFWRTEEESLDGICEVSYQLNELPSYMVKEQPRVAPFHKTCEEGSKYYELVKTRDISSCSRRTAYMYYKPGFYQCSTGNCEGMFSKSSITRYVACGKEGELKIQTIVNEGELHQNLLGFNSEKFVTGSFQNLTLVSQESSSMRQQESLPWPNNGIELTSLYYEYKLKTGVQKESALLEQALLEETAAHYQSLPRNVQLTGVNGQQERGKVNIQNKVIPQMKTLFKTIVNEDLFNIIDIPEKQITMKGLMLGRAFSLLEVQDITELYNELKNEFNGDDQKKQMFQNVFFDTVIMGGSIHNVKFIKNMILQRELSPMQVVSIFTFLPHYVVTPTEGLLESLFDLVRSDVIRKEYVYNHAVLSFSQLIQRACLTENRATSYPTFVFGSFCSPDSNIVLMKWLPYLEEELLNAGTSEHRNIIIVSLGLLSHKSVIPIIVPYLEKMNSHNTEYSKLTRYLAVYSLTNVGRVYPETVIPVIYSLYSNPGESTEVRIAAFNVLIRLNPSMTVYQRIATSTWWEKDSEVLQVVNTALWSLSQQQERGVDSIYTNAQRKAWLIYPFIRKTAGTFATSGVVYTQDNFVRLGVGYRQINSWINSKDSLIPTDVFGRIVYFMDRFQFSPVEYALRLRGGDNLLQQIIDLLNPEQVQQNQENQAYENIKQKIHHEWAQAIQKLQLKSRDKSSMAEGALFFNLFEDSPIFHSFQSTTAEMLKEKILPLARGSKQLRQLIQGENAMLNFQRMFNLAPLEISIPSDLGLPVLIELHMPVTLSARGNMTVRAEGQHVGKINMKIQTLYAAQYTGMVGTVIPFTNEFVTTGIDEHSVVNLPAEISVVVDVPEQKVNVKVHGLDVEKPIDLLHFHVRPFTSYQQAFDLTPITLNRNVKFIKSVSPVTKKEWNFGDVWGLELKTVLTTETPFVDLRALYQKFEMYHYNPLNFLRFSWVNTAQNEIGLPSLRRHEVQLKFNPGQSVTKEVEFQIQLGWATKEQKEQPFKLQTIKRVESHENQGGLIPLKVVSEELGTSRRQEKLQQIIKDVSESHELDEGQCFVVRVNSIIKRSERQAGTSTYVFKLLSGRKGFSQKWDLQLENESKNQKLCINGQLNVPSIPVWNIEEIRRDPLRFSYANVIGYGSTCKESQIRVFGGTKSSQKQKEFSRKSEEGQLLKELLQKRITTPELFDVAEKVRRQASILDEVNFTFQYINVPEEDMRRIRFVREGVKALLWPYFSTDRETQVEMGQDMNSDVCRLNPEQGPCQQHIPMWYYDSESRECKKFDYGGCHGNGNKFLTREECELECGSSQNQQQQQSGSDTETDKVRLVFPPGTSTYDMYLTTPQESVQFKHVRIPRPLTYLFPIAANRENIVEQLPKSIVGKPIWPACKVTGKWLETYDNVTTAIPLEDNCYHLLTADCSHSKKFAVLVRKTSQQASNVDGPMKQLKIYIGKTKVELIPESSESSPAFPKVKVIVNETKEIDVEEKRGHYVRVFDQHDKEVLRVMLSVDGVIVLQSSNINVLFNGEKIRIETDYAFKNKLCGLCGDSNGNKLADLRGPQQCVYSKPELLVASYRVHSDKDSCDELPRHVQQQLQAETQQCTKFQEIPTSVVGTLKQLSGKCAVHQHQVVEKATEICFSQIPIMECGAMCRPSKVVEKSVPFVCVPRGKVANLYAQKASAGERIPVESLEKSYSTQMHLPKSCERVNRNW